MYINYQQNFANRSVIPRTQMYSPKKIVSCIKDGQTDGTTGGRTNRHRVRQQSVVFFKKKYQKQMHARRTSIFLLCKNVL